jgi:hypothetical protein
VLNSVESEQPVGGPSRGDAVRVEEETLAVLKPTLTARELRMR